jgi:hypothetical protein
MEKDKRIVFTMSEGISIKLAKLKQVDKRSIQKELEWLIDKRFEEVSKG